VLYLPWSEYQKYGDPPGNRVTAWQLAGNLNPSGAPQPPLLTQIRRAYAEAGVGGTIHNKVENYDTMVGGEAMATELSGAYDQLKHGSPSGALTSLRSVLFFYPLPSLGPLVFVPFLMLAAVRRRRALARLSEWSAAAWLYLTLVIGYAAWGLILFGNSVARPVNHTGSFAMPILGLTAGVLGIRALYPRFGIWFTGICAALSLAIYVPVLEPAPYTRYSPAAALIGCVCLMGFIVCALEVDPRRLIVIRRRQRQRLVTGI
jgi:hypothetical protein